MVIERIIPPTELIKLIADIRASYAAADFFCKVSVVIDDFSPARIQTLGRILAGCTGNFRIVVPIGEPVQDQRIFACYIKGVTYVTESTPDLLAQLQPDEVFYKGRRI